MATAITTTDPAWVFDIAEWEKQAATVLKANAVTTNAERATFVANLTAAQQLAAVRALLNCLITKV